MRVKILLSVLALTLSGLAVVAGPVAAAAPEVDTAATSVAGGFQPMGPTRLLDTRSGLGAPAGLLGGRTALSLVVAGRGGVPAAGVGAVALNVTAITPRAVGTITVHPHGSAVPAITNLSLIRNRTIANLVIVAVGTGGRVDLVNTSAGGVDLTVEVTGYYRAGSVSNPGAFQVKTPARLLDTRKSLATTTGSTGPNSTLQVSALGLAGIPSTGVGALVLNVTVLAPTAAGYLAVFPGGTSRPNTSNINFQAQADLPNLVTVPVGATGGIALFNGSSGRIQLVIDVVGYYLAGGASAAGTLVSGPPVRIADTRSGLGVTAGAVPKGGTAVLHVTGPGRPGILSNTVSAVALNITMATPTGASGYITVFRSGTVPTASTQSSVQGQTRAALALVPVAPDGTVRIYNGTAGPVQLMADLAGAFLDSSLAGSGLAAGQQLNSGQTRQTSNGQVRLIMQTDGNLVLQAQGSTLWRSGTSGSPGAVAAMQADGNLVVYSTSGRALWASSTYGSGVMLRLSNDGTFSVFAGGRPLFSTDLVNSTLIRGRTLQAGFALYSADRQYLTAMGADGNLSVRRSTGQIVWTSGTLGHPGAVATQLTDGNLVVHQGSKVYWTTRTSGYAGAMSTVQDDGRLVVYSPIGSPIWWAEKGRVTSASLCNGTKPDPSGTTITRWNPITLCVLSVLDQSADNLSDVNILIKYESAGNANAVNDYDINAQNGHPSKGLIQVIQPTFDAYRSLQLSGDLLNPAANLYAGLNYALHRYGSIHNIPGLVSLRSGGGYKGYIVTR